MTQRLCRSTAATVALLVSLAAAGCRKPEIVPVSGRVTFEGRPVPQAILRFLPESRPMASGGTDADGRYSLSTKRPGDGGYLGRHKVMIVPWLPVDSDESAEAAAARTRPRPDIPKPYHSATTPLSVEVTAKGPNVFDFELATEDGRPRRETTGQK